MRSTSPKLALSRSCKGEHLLLDTNVLIYQLNGKKDFSDDFAQAKSLNISAITEAELFAGIDKQDFTQLQEYLQLFRIIPVSSEIAKLAGAYKASLARENRLKDLIIAATAQLHKLTLVSANKKDFEGFLSKKSIWIS